LYRGAQRVGAQLADGDGGDHPQRRSDHAARRLTHGQDRARRGSAPRCGLDALSLRPRHSRGSSNTALKAMKMMTPIIAAKNTAGKETVDSIMSATRALPPPRKMQ